jgi:two-component system, sensor histidine kinase RpfC
VSVANLDEYARLANSVREQARLRAIMGVAIVAVGMLWKLFYGLDGYTAMRFGLAYGAYIATALLATSATARARLPAASSEWIATATAVLDPVYLTVFLLLLGEAAPLGVALYLFTILGFGFRIGPKYLRICQAASIAGFAIVPLFVPFFHLHLLDWASYLITLILVPAYAALLLRKLHEARTAAEHASTAKSQLLARVSHELRTPLTGIVAATELLLGESGDRAAQERGRQILDLSRELLQEINQLLYQSKHDANAIVLVPEPSDLSKCLDYVRLNVESAATQKRVHLKFFTDPNIQAPVLADNYHLKRVLINLAGNAVKFSEDGSVEVRADLVDQSPEAYWVRFSVKDTGIGIDPEMHARIFEPFFQVDSSVTRNFGGTGLGLSLARAIVLMMGSDISLESSPGKGSQFWFTVRLPLSQREAVAAAAAAPARIVHAKRILVADDNETNLVLLRQMLERDDHKVDIARSGAEALERLTSSTYDLVLLDYNMGDIDGCRVLQVYRVGTPNPAPTYFLTADATATTAERLADAGALDVLIKPITLDTLRRAICRAIEPDTAAPAPAAGSERPAGSGRKGILAVVESPVLDEAVLDELRSLDDQPGFIRDLVRQASMDIERNTAELRDALHRGDRSAIHDTAHAIKGIAASVGATRLAALMSRVMQEADQPMEQNFARRVNACQLAVSEALESLRAVVADQVATRR